MTTNTLLVFAHADEAEAFAETGVPHLITGVGKINAAQCLSEVILAPEKRPERIVVLGTAGAVSDDARLDTVYQIETAVQHDYSLPSPAVQPQGERLAGVPGATIATGDVFVQNDAQREMISALGATLVDMESYAYAVVCERLGLPLQIFKAPSDFADSSTTQDEWDGVVMSKSEQLLQFARHHLPEVLA